MCPWTVDINVYIWGFMLIFFQISSICLSSHLTYIFYRVNCLDTISSNIIFDHVSCNRKMFSLSHPTQFLILMNSKQWPIVFCTSSAWKDVLSPWTIIVKAETFWILTLQYNYWTCFNWYSLVTTDRTASKQVGNEFTCSNFNPSFCLGSINIASCVSVNKYKLPLNVVYFAKITQTQKIHCNSSLTNVWDKKHLFYHKYGSWVEVHE